MAQALAAVKRDLGVNAVILNTRTFKRWRFPALWRRTIVEVTATLGQEQTGRPRTSSTRPASIAAGAARRAYSPQVVAKAPVAAIAPVVAVPRASAAEASASSLEQDRQRTRRLAMAMVEQLDRQKSAAPRPPEVPAGVVCSSASTTVTPTIKPAEPSQTVSPSAQATHPGAGAARRFILNEPSILHSVANRTFPYDSSSGQTQAMQEELIAIRSMVSQVLERQPPSGPSDDLPHLPQHLLDMYVRLIGQDLSEDLADQVVRGVRDELDDEQLADESKVRTAVLRHLARIVPVTPDAAYEPNADGRPVVIAMVGPTGVGKTTTLAKLAATFKLHHHLRVGLITADTYRIAAVEQLRTYANIIGLPLEVVLTPVQMREALDRLADRRSLDGGGCDVILIDTAGRSQNDTGRIDELRKFVEAAKPDQVHLVLSSTAGERVLLREAEAFSPLGIHRIVLTKLDEAVSFGMLINVIRKVGKQLSFVTTGQEVPEHLEPGRADRLAELVLGGPLHR
jgi:flagellar biosynthesis protein FlhF